MRLAARAPFASDAVFAYLRTRALPGVERADGAWFERAIVGGDRTAVVAVRPSGAAHVDVRTSDVSLRAVACERVRFAFGLDVDASGVARHLGRDPLLRVAVRRRPGLRVPRAFDAFELGVRAIVGQQVSVAGARTVAGRIVARYAPPLARDETRAHGLRAFPAAATLADASFDGCGLTRAKIAAIRALAAAVASGAIVLDASQPAPAAIDALVELPGIGPWTAAYIAMRGLGDPDAFPAADLGLRKLFERAGLPAGRKRIEEYAERWRPWRAFATLYAWESLATE